MTILDFNKKQEAIILLTLTLLVAVLFFNHDKLDNSNVLTMFFELAVAGFIGFILARYYFNKDRQLQKREKIEQKNKLKNEFEHSLRKSHSQIWIELNQPGQNTIPRSSLMRMDNLLSETILAFKNFAPTDLDSNKIIHDASMLIKKHIDSPMSDHTLMIDLQLSLNLLGKIGEKYHIDLTPV